MLTILIPTYNRAADVVRNLEHWRELVESLAARDRIEIVVSDNASTDATPGRLAAWQAAEGHRVRIVRQASNLGLEGNVMALLELARTPYVMFCGDDDFVQAPYVKEVLALLAGPEPPAAVLPDFVRVSVDGRVLGRRGRDRPPRRFRRGRWTAALRMGYGHQMSGVVVRREGLAEAYATREAASLYPFIFFVGWNALHGDVVHLAEAPVRVTEGALKYWAYGPDALHDQRLKNYRAVFGRRSPMRVVGEVANLVQGGAYGHHLQLRRGPATYLRHLVAVARASNVSLPTRLLYVPLCLSLGACALVRRVVQRTPST